LRLYFGDEKCVTIYGCYEWESAVQKIEGDERLNDDERESLLHLFQHQAKFVPLDDQGRIVIPPEARDFAALQKDVMIVGDGNKLHVVNRDLYRRVDRVMRSGAEANPRLLRRVEH